MADSSPLPPQTDPFSKAYSGFCDSLFSHPNVAALVQPGNQIRFDLARSEEEKWSKTTADKPELEVAYQGYSGGKQISCSTWQGTLVFLLKIDSGDQRLNRGMLALSYACLKAITNCRNGHDKLRNVDIPFVIGIDQTPLAFAQLEDFKATDGEKAWSSFCRVSLTVQFDDLNNLP